jgi:methylated-DNA-[protein]-cysteine S-methyltransferase
MEYTVFETILGWVAVLGSARGLVCISLPCGSSREALEVLGEAITDARFAPASFKDITRRLKDYLGGYEVSFPDELDLSPATPFQQKVWQAARKISYGETRSYQWLAEKIGQPGAARATGQALSRNPLPIIIPCHRVVSSDGGLGGFSGGIEMKRRLLLLEGAPISHQR